MVGVLTSPLRPPSRPNCRNGEGGAGRAERFGDRRPASFSRAPAGPRAGRAWCPAVFRGEGRVASKRRTFRIRIPAGIWTGQVIRLREFGAPGRHGGAPGNLYATVHVDD
ncbi:DnaJ C-terminal domain-containing protein [Streptomyces sp. NPDC002215]|uniref:DnaJ C-terminal domain-containing protein n=1 Tax=Streptomyces sp. NPDC002215 TaxID=3154412 RepID=UPI003327BD15